MGRRGHKKSRLGCAECKQRHVKCDETRPTCVNCKTAGIVCSYTKEQEITSTPGSESHTDPALVLPSLPTDTNFNDLPITPIPITPPTSTAVNFDHLELLHQFQSETYKAFVTNESIAYNYMQTAIRHGFQHQFLMYEVLALSSMRLSIFRPERASFYRRQSADLRLLAVEGFKQVMANINDDNYIAVFMFSSMMGFHAFCETFTSFQASWDFNQIMDRFTDSMNLIRGILVVMEGFWEKLGQSELKDMLEAGNVYRMKGLQGDECSPLRQLIQQADLSEKSKQACEKAVSDLQLAFMAERHSTQSEAAVNPFFAWVVTAGEAYVNLLQQRRPEALIILAYYGIILHRKRTSWAIQDGGKYLVHAIVKYLGTHWSQWLEWPLSVIGEGSLSSTQTPSTSAYQSPLSFQHDVS